MATSNERFRISEVTSIRLAVVAAAIMLFVGVVYATGIEGGHRFAGVALIVFAAGSFVSAWRVAATLRRTDERRATRRDISS